MGIEVYTVKCPSCGANLPVEKGRSGLFCSYCGTRVVISNANEFTIRTVDEAAIEKVKAEKTVEIKKIDNAEKARIDKKNARELKIKISLVLGLSSFLMVFFGFSVDSLYGMFLVGILGIAILGFMWMGEITGETRGGVDIDGEWVKVPSIVEKKIQLVSIR